MRGKLSILLALAAILAAMLACENTDAISGPADYAGRGYSCPSGQYLSSDDAGHAMCRIAR